MIEEEGDEMMYIFFFKQKTAYEIKECDWSSDVCSSDLYILAEVCSGKDSKSAIKSYVRHCIPKSLTSDEKGIGRASCRERV